MGVLTECWRPMRNAHRARPHSGPATDLVPRTRHRSKPGSPTSTARSGWHGRLLAVRHRAHLPRDQADAPEPCSAPTIARRSVGTAAPPASAPVTQTHCRAQPGAYPARTDAPRRRSTPTSPAGSGSFLTANRASRTEEQTCGECSPPDTHSGHDVQANRRFDTANGPKPAETRARKIDAANTWPDETAQFT